MKHFSKERAEQALFEVEHNLESAMSEIRYLMPEIKKIPDSVVGWKEKAEALECLLSRELRYIGSRYPLCSVIRTRKFIARGWTINAGQYLKMLLQVSELDLVDVEVLEDQLVGVDTAYFEEVIRLMREHLKENNIKEIDRTYLAQVIDRIF